MSARVSIFNTVKGSRVPRGRLTRLAEIVLRAQKCRRDVNLIFVSDGKMAGMNRQFRHKERTTDVLSFNLEDDADPLLGEIYISIPEARRNAANFAVSFTDEVLRLFCHGLLHLCGIHHPDEKSTSNMNRMVERYLAKITTREKR